LLLGQKFCSKDQSCEASCCDRWVTEEGWFLVVMAALQICHELHGCCSVTFILLLSRVYSRKSREESYVDLRDHVCIHMLFVTRSFKSGDAPQAEVARPWRSLQPIFAIDTTLSTSRTELKSPMLCQIGKHRTYLHLEER
jgi:hypothetical protein